MKHKLKYIPNFIRTSFQHWLSVRKPGDMSASSEASSRLHVYSRKTYFGINANKHMLAPELAHRGLSAMNSIGI